MEKTSEPTPRLDILLYAHDGRGLGHASRSVAIGLALRRLFPSLKVLLISGCKTTQELIGPGLLDWIKLPSYATVVSNGVSRGIDGNSGIGDRELGILRTRQIADIIRLYRPRVVVADHSPQGKHRELLQALETSVDCLWILGMRAIPGQLSAVRMELAATVFSHFYHGLLWYGDSRVLGPEPSAMLERHFGIAPLHCGYVSRMAELMKIKTREYDGAPLAGTVAIPWLGEGSVAFLQTLATVLKRIGPGHGHWQLFIDDALPQSEEVYRYFRDLPYCSLEKPGPPYIAALLRSKTAVVYGGYNSLMDILSLSLPALVVLRDMEDQEQQLHLEKILTATGGAIAVCSEGCSSEQLYTTLLEQLTGTGFRPATIALNGAEAAAEYLRSLLQEAIRDINH